LYIFKNNAVPNDKTDITSQQHKKAMLDKAEEFLEYVKKNKSKNTYNVYGFGLRKFLDWIKTDPNTIIADAKKKFLAEDRETREYWKRQIETFYNSLLKDGLMQNSNYRTVKNNHARERRNH
jgi:predicted metal-dependent hydrolase